MESLSWITAHWFDLLQTAGIVGGLVFTGVIARRDERARAIGNAIAIKQQYREIWQELYDRPKLFRILKADVDLKSNPLTDEEELFVTQLILHLDTVFRAKQAGVFVEIGGLRKDVANFLSLPIPRQVWTKLKPYQDKDFVTFVENAAR